MPRIFTGTLCAKAVTEILSFIFGRMGRNCIADGTFTIFFP